MKNFFSLFIARIFVSFSESGIAYASFLRTVCRERYTLCAGADRYSGFIF